MKGLIKLLKVVVLTLVLLSPFFYAGIGGIVIYVFLSVLVAIVETIRKECFGATNTIWDAPEGGGQD